ncbi:hypothetical protein L0337_11670 [candidate division KSB1 bacterium]|nr:hypothetical protein [candidate division KSB1 bacterium]
MNKLMLMLALFFLAFPALAQLNEQQLKEYEARLAANHNKQEALLKLGIHYHNRGGDGDEKAVEKAVDFAFIVAHADSSNLEKSERVQAYYFYGLTLKQEGRIDEAERMWRNAVNLWPEHPLAARAAEELKK